MSESMNHLDRRRAPFVKFGALSSLSLLLALGVSGCMQTEEKVPEEKNSISLSVKKSSLNPIESSKSESPAAATESSQGASDPREENDADEVAMPLQWDSYEVVDETNIKFSFLAESAPDPCSGYEVDANLKETETTVQPVFTYSVPDYPDKCVPFDWAASLSLDEPLGDRKIIE